MTSPASFADATTRHALPVLFPGQAQKEFTLNEALARIDLLLHPVVVEERDSPPPGPEAGSSYLVGSPATGEFSGRDGSIAGWDGQQWTFAAPTPGMTAHDLSSGETLRFSGNWQRLAAPVAPAGGAIVDDQARAVIADLIAALRNFGVFS